MSTSSLRNSRCIITGVMAIEETCKNWPSLLNKLRPIDHISTGSLIYVVVCSFFRTGPSHKLF